MSVPPRQKTYSTVNRLSSEVSFPYLWILSSLSVIASLNIQYNIIFLSEDRGFVTATESEKIFQKRLKEILKQSDLSV